MSSKNEKELVVAMKEIEFLRQASKDYEDAMGLHPNMIAWLETRREQYIESRIEFYQEQESKDNGEK